MKNVSYIKQLAYFNTFLGWRNSLYRWFFNSQKAWTPQQPFHGKLLYPEILYQILSYLNLMSVKSGHTLAIAHQFLFCFVVHQFLSGLPIIVDHWPNVCA